MGMGVDCTSPGSGGVDNGTMDSGGGTFGLVAMARFSFLMDRPPYLRAFSGGVDSSGRGGSLFISASASGSAPSLGMSSS